MSPWWLLLIIPGGLVIGAVIGIGVWALALARSIDW